ncbi:MAG: tRNA pseudouridine(13) synthase TruD, partial [Candidatus Methanoperedens sp.]|nr:tRNA pseudouridine(13) synthase TruD [Candidatus Methanoperedens sp.]
EGRMGEIEQEVIKESNIDTEGFKVPGMPEIASKGLRREIVLPVKPEFSVMEDEVNSGKTKVVLEFTLQKGGYATVVLREYMKGQVATL